ncbi:hypothetical protein MVES_002734 [Malassezia vespertilionis]|uniref:Tyrosine-protein phosphatase domain-containing protein n=1 Tax=Malassezia vespertilionis TaxID=2020962 RepID=A0A2N1J986_9BASI|nr:hypothetical protein MVES_002734 [Malassezia vespertilionis]
MESNAARILNELNNLDYERRDDSSLLQGPYLNASYIPAFPGSIEGSLACIVSQAPTPSTFQAFFHHLHAQKVNVLVNLTPLEEGGMVKSDQYWPTTPTSPLHFADNALKISLLPDAPSGLPLLQNLAYRSLQISNVKENWSHTVTLLHYTGWKDHEEGSR